jgi:undecaprenyl-diphosphatase
VTLLFFILFHRAVPTQKLLCIGFAMTTFFLLIDRWLPAEKKRRWVWYEPLLIGCAQGIAFLPGVSRLAITYGAARVLSFSPRHAFEFSFLIEAPISAAAFFKGLYDLYQLGMLNLLNLPICLIMVIAGIAAHFILSRCYALALTGWWYLFACYTALLTAALLIF